MIKIHETQDKTVYEAVKEIFKYLGLDEKMTEQQFKKLSGKYKDYIVEEAKTWD